MLFRLTALFGSFGGLTPSVRHFGGVGRPAPNSSAAPGGWGPRLHGPGRCAIDTPTSLGVSDALDPSPPAHLQGLWRSPNLRGVGTQLFQKLDEDGVVGGFDEVAIEPGFLRFTAVIILSPSG